MANVRFNKESFDDFLWYVTNDKNKVKKIKELINDISRNGEKEGIGHPEPLKDNLSGYYSREIDKKNRLVYRVEEETICILSVKTHYGDK